MLVRSPRPTLGLLAALVVATAAVPARAQTVKSSVVPGFQLQIDALAVTPIGSISGGDLSDRFGSGPGFAVTGTAGINRRLLIGARVAYFNTTQDGVSSFSDGGGLGAIPEPAPSGPYDVERRLIGTPIHGLVQFRQPLATTLTLFGELGAGLTTFIEKDEVSSNGTHLFNISGYQQNFSAIGGGGVSVAMGSRFELVADINLLKVFTDSGDVWADGDDPQFVTATLGIRYPRY